MSKSKPLPPPDLSAALARSYAAIAASRRLIAQMQPFPLASAPPRDESGNKG